MPAQRIAVIGGNLLGCATASHLLRDTSHAERHAVTVFEAEPCLGGRSFQSVAHPDADGAPVEVGTCRALRLFPGSFLEELVRGDALPGLAGFLGKRRARVEVEGVAEGRGFGVWEWGENGAGDWIFRVRGDGWIFPQILVRGLQEIWVRALLFSLLVMYLRNGGYSDGGRLLLGFIGVLVLGFGPGYGMKRFETGVSFWSSTVAMLGRYGLVVGLARGADLGFMKEISTMREGALGRFCLTAGSFMQRVGLENYAHGSVADMWRRWKYDASFVGSMLAPIVAGSFGGRDVEDVNALAGCYGVMGGDWGNSDVTKQYVRVQGGNARLCEALIGKSELKLETRVVRIAKVAEGEKRGWSVGYVGGDGVRREEFFDGVVLSARLSLESGIELELEREDVEVAELLGDCAPKLGGEEEKTVGAGVEKHYTAAVHGVLRPSFFGFSRECDVPDRVRPVHCDKFSFFERVSGPRNSSDERGVYVVDCKKNFMSDGGVAAEMFTVVVEDFKLLYFQPQPSLLNGLRAVTGRMSVDDVVPFVVFGERFVYAAATDRLVRSAEFDAMIAVNSASLYDAVVGWEDDGDVAEDPSDNGIPDDE